MIIVDSLGKLYSLFTPRLYNSEVKANPNLAPGCKSMVAIPLKKKEAAKMRTTISEADKTGDQAPLQEYFRNLLIDVCLCAVFTFSFISSFDLVLFFFFFFSFSKSEMIFQKNGLCSFSHFFSLFDFSFLFCRA